MNTTDIVPYKIEDEQFGDLIKMPKLYLAGKLSAENAKVATDRHMKRWEAIADITTADAAAVEAILAPIRQLRTKLDNTAKSLNAARSPHTQKMAAIASAFVSLENSVKASFGRTKSAEDAWQLELLRRSAAATAAATVLLNEKTAKINRKLLISQAINLTFGKDLTAKIVAMHKKFYEFTDATALTAWVDLMRKYVPIYDGKEVQREAIGVLDEILEVRAELIEGFKTEYVERMGAERDKLIDLYAGRLLQLKAGAPVDVVVRPEEFAGSVMRVVHAMNEDAGATASKESINAAFDSTPDVVTPSEGGKGKVQKKKYQCNSIEALQTIMQSWVKHNMNQLSIEELNKKLSFMRTAADVRLNEGKPLLEAKGLVVVDDISTRTRKTTEA